MLFSNSVSSSFFVRFEQFKKLLVRHLKLLENSWKSKENEAITKEFEHQNSICFYVFKSNINPLHFQGHILFILKPI
jgi:hypothetical protein